MRISVFGLGYVGAVTAGCLAQRGHTVIGVDVHPQKVADLGAGRAPIIEPGLDRLLQEAHQRGLLKATQSCAEAIGESEVSLVCVGTPSKHTGSLDLTHVREVTRQIAHALAAKSTKHHLIYRSTMLPGSTRSLVESYLAEAQRAGRVEVMFYPEFLRESTAVADFDTPSLAVVGTSSGQPADPRLRDLFGGNVPVVNWETAEMIKYACNAFHAAKVTFANEIGRLGKQMGVDARLVMELLCSDTRLNLSPYYMKPGNPFGGSCLPKDVRALTDYARQQGLELPLIENLLSSNQQHLQSLLQLVAERGQREVIILGLSFKSHTDDLRESSMVEVAQSLLGHGYVLRIYDPQLNLARVTGSNKRVVDLKMPHLASLLCSDLPSALGKGGLVLVAQRCVELSELARLVRPDHHLVDINGWDELRALPISYEGFCW